MLPNTGANAHFFGVVSASLFLFAAVSGCASDNSLVQRAHKLHSYTPCGMVMDAVMPPMEDHSRATAETEKSLHDPKQEVDQSAH